MYRFVDQELEYKRGSNRFRAKAPATFADVGLVRVCPASAVDEISGSGMRGKSIIMRKNSSKRCVLYGIVLAAAWRIGGPAASDGESYLPTVGPPPLRYYSVRTLGAFNLPPLPSESGDSADVTVCPASTGDLTPLRSSVLTETPVDFLLPAALWLSRFSGTNGLGSLLPTSLVSLTNSIAVCSAAGDLLAVTPEMLVDYFKPAQCPSNAANIMVVVPLGFTPATPAGAASSATYRTP